MLKETLGDSVNEEMQAKFKMEFNTAVGGLLSTLRQSAGLTLEDVGQAMAKTRIEKVRRLEAGEASPNGSDLIELAGLYGASMVEVSASIQEIGSNARAKYPWSSSALPGVVSKREEPATTTSPQEPAPNAP